MSSEVSSVGDFESFDYLCTYKSHQCYYHKKKVVMPLKVMSSFTHVILFKDPRPVKILKSTVHICTSRTKYYNIKYVYVRTALLLPLFSPANFQSSPGAKKGKKGRAAILYFPLCQIFRRFFSMDLGV